MSASAGSRWDRQMSADPATVLADLMTSAVTGEMTASLGLRPYAYASGLERLFELLSARSDAERLDGKAAVVGADFARLASAARGERAHITSCGAAIVPLRPILADFRDQAFS